MMHDEFFGEFPSEEIVGPFMSSYRFQEATSGDRPNLMRLENKCYDYPLNQDEWAEILSSAPKVSSLPNSLSSYRCMTYRVGVRIVGFYIYNNKPDEEDFLEVIRLGVHPDHRGQGFGTCLVDHMEKKAGTLGLQFAQITIPEYWLDPQEERGVINFVETSGLVPVNHLRDHYFHYGKLYDGIIYRTGGKRVEFVSH